MEPSSKAQDEQQSEAYFPFRRVEADGDGSDLKGVPELAEPEARAPGAPESH